MRYRKVCTAMVAAAAIGLAGCGSSADKSSSASSSGSTAANSAPSSGSGAISIGFVCTCSGPVSESFAGAQQTITAWVDNVNATGGLAGHQLKLYSIDDGGNATTSLTGVKKLVQQDHVVAIVGDSSVQDVTWASYISSTGVPVVGGLSLNLPFQTNQDFFPSGTTFTATFYAEVADAQRYGPKFGSIYCVESPTCAEAVPVYNAAAQSLGMTVSYSSSVSATQPDYTAVCESLKASGAEAYNIGDAAQIVARIAADCAQAGVTAKVSEPGLDAGPTFPSGAGTDGAMLNLGEFPSFDTSLPATQKFHAVLAKYYPQYESGNGPSETNAWAGGELFAAAVAASHSSDITSATVKKGLYNIQGDNLGGLTPPLTFTQGHTTAVDCWFLVSVQNQKFIEPQGMKVSCASPSTISSIASSTGGS